ncbi:YceI family protein [Helicobacter cappadocius]|uniref:YceI family protein n=1 Tax=Helicobacter cappadocius TaxID=3063998 RepID=A0AA90PXX0_9HELI|nr:MULTISPECIES: YceI family protein [unclassified Helicobacter]MDO7252666.1 YceI family protein [Helicobacter sp. faydin-H75]MDP2538533.1 YceI family protein [Helicobacter sp. faydin-H76]
MNKFLSLAAVSAICLTPMMAKPFIIDKSHSSVGFQVEHMLISKVNGEFDNFEGTLDIDPKTKKINKLEGQISISSIDTKNKKRDAHLNANDFFDSGKFQKATFKMTKQEGDKIYGDLTIKNITKPVIWELEINGPVTNPNTKKQLMALDIEGKINRKDFQVGESTPNSLVSDEVKVKIQIEASE